MLGGPCTFGPGKMAQIELTHYIRKMNDLIDSKETKQMVDDACKFY